LDQQPRRYRIRVYDDGAEVLTDREYVAVLDLTPGAGLRQTEAKLDDLAQTLARADGARGDRVGRYYLAVHDRETDEFEFHWPAKTID
jgi:hypothetical protein